MEIDRDHMLMCFAWAHTDRFEMTEAMAIAVMEKLFLKAGSARKHVLEEPISCNNLVSLFYSTDMIDDKNIKGISRPKLELTFRNTIQHMPRRLAARENKMALPRGVKTKPRRRHHRHKGVVG